MQPSLKKYLKSLRVRGKLFANLWTTVAYPKDKLKFLILNILGSLPLPQIFVVKILDTFTPILTNVKLKIYGVYFVAVDLESFEVLLPSHEPWLWKYLKLREGDVFIDAGAHIGKYTLLAAKITGNSGMVVSIEPHPKNFDAIAESVKLNMFKNVILVNAALWSEETTLRLYEGNVAERHSLVKPSEKYIIVRTRSLDSIIEELNPIKIDWVKIDVVGSELEVLKGMNVVLSNYKPRLVAEVWNENLKDFISFLSDKNYKYFIIRAGHRVTYILGVPLST
ncbi:MAG: FkbM family methyltransferase [Candidatus Bathyarchaeia archaeon]